MIEIINKNKFPIQIIVKSRKSPKSFTTKIIPSAGSGLNSWICDDERITEYVERLQDAGLITINNISSDNMTRKVN